MSKVDYAMNIDEMVANERMVYSDIKIPVFKCTANNGSLGVNYHKKMTSLNLPVERILNRSKSNF